MRDSCFVAVSFAQAAAAASRLASSAATDAERCHFRRVAASITSVLILYYPDQVEMQDGGRDALREGVMVRFPLFPDVARFRVEIDALCGAAAEAARAAIRRAAQGAVPAHVSSCHPGLGVELL